MSYVKLRSTLIYYMQLMIGQPMWSTMHNGQYYLKICHRELALIRLLARVLDVTFIVIKLQISLKIEPGSIGLRQYIKKY